MEFQIEANNKRKKKWNEYRLEKEVKDMWNKMMESAYNQVLAGAGNKKTIQSYIENNNVVEFFDEAMRDLNFGEE
ncbi:hypothetical protein [Peptostreptococcus faecalis]|uniref:hypothetical protein n=1 Tax=Peptostreptococcus faecalis TaxID=2045015 RepID=UPI000C7D12F3|nr:hypothetical protein [Peptostreptococcus faecalis]